MRACVTALLFLVLVALVCAQSSSDVDCSQYEWLPENLNQINWLGMGTNRLHLHGNFLTKFTQRHQRVSFSLTVPSVARFYAAPNSIDIDLWLYNTSSAYYMAHSQLGLTGEENLAAVIGPGSFYLDLMFFPWGKKPNECSTAIFEIEILPVSDWQTRVAAVTPATVERLPAIDFSGLTPAGASPAGVLFESMMGGQLTFGSSPSPDSLPTIETYVVLFNASLPARSARWVTVYNFTLPLGPNAWELDATLGYNFLLDGSLSLVLMSQATTPNDLALQCVRRGSCVKGANVRPNEHVLTTSLIAGGSYSLYIVDDYSMRIRSQLGAGVALPAATEFSFSLLLVPTDYDETFENCAASTMLASLAEYPADADGSYHISQDVLLPDVSQPASMRITLTQSTFLRMRVDLTTPGGQGAQLGLYNGTVASFPFQYGSSTSTSSSWAGPLAPGVYTLVLMPLAGLSLPCYAVHLTLSTMPMPWLDTPQPAGTMTLFDHYCPTPALPNNLPDFSAFEAALLATGPRQGWLLTNGSLALGARNSYQAGQDRFWVSTPTTVRFSLHTDFLYSDMDIWLSAFGQTNTSATYTTRDYATHEDGSIYLAVDLMPGSYQVQFVAYGYGYQYSQALSDADYYPGCARFAIYYATSPFAAPANQAATMCSNADGLFSTFNLPGLLTTSRGHSMHVSQPFLVPPITAYSVARDVSFTLNVTSLFRCYTEPHVADIDFYLYAGSRLLLPASVGVNTEEKLINVLQPGSYRLHVVFYRPFSRPEQLAPCSTWNLELSITPVALLPSVPAAQCTPVLPPRSLVPSLDSSFYSEAVYTLVQNRSQSQTVHIDFNMTALLSSAAVQSDGVLELRAVLYYSFAWSDLQLRLRDKGDNKGTGHSVLSYGTNGYNRNELHMAGLAADGYYVLEVYQPAALPGTLLASMPAGQVLCSSFTLQLGAVVRVPASKSLGANVSEICSGGVMPPMLTSPAYVWPTSGWATHLVRDVVFNPSSPAQSFNFDQTSYLTLSVPSSLHLFTPARSRQAPSSYQATQLWLRLTVIDTATGRSVAYVASAHELQMTLSLPVGTYALRYLVFDLLATLDECVGVPVELSVVPMNDGSFPPPLLAAKCDVKSPPSTLLIGSTSTFTPQTYRAQVSTAASAVVFTSSFTAASPVTLDARVGSYFQAEQKMYMLLTGMVDDVYGRVPVYWESQFGMNAAWMHEDYLPSGVYTLKVYAPTVTTAVGALAAHNISCAPFTFGYLLNYTTAQPGPASCKYPRGLPTDLWNATGGSARWGGPQSVADGSIRIYDTRFALPFYASSSVKTVMAFRVLVPSVLSVWAAEFTPGVDIDLILYADASLKNRIAQATGDGTSSAQQSENLMVTLDPAVYPQPVLQVVFYRTEVEPCTTFAFEFALQPLSLLQQSLICPVVLPPVQLPPSSIEFNGGVGYTGGEYVLTSQTYRKTATVSAGHWHQYITLTINSANATLDASVDYDFMSSRFFLVLQPPTGAKAISSQPDVENFRSDWLSAREVLHLEGLAAGQYRLAVEFRDVATNQGWYSGVGNSTWCRPFDFALTLSDPGVPVVMSVDPPGGTLLDPRAPFIVTIKFSEAVTNYQRPVVRKLVQLKDMDSGVLLNLTYAMWGTDGPQTLTASFGRNQLDYGRSYTVIVHSEELIGAVSNAPFYPYIGTSLYSTFSCQCDLHGNCVAGNDTTVCVCDAGYTGRQCQDCARGFHAAGATCNSEGICSATCIPNTYCADLAQPCNAHGSCDDSDGYPVCSCYDGFATVGDNYCGQCALGYSGYPSCTLNDADAQESTHCDAPVFPSSLDMQGLLQGTAGYVHLADNYFINAPFIHYTSMTLFQDSYLHLYAQPHWVDVDFAVLDGSGRMVDWSYAWNREDTIVVRLNASASGTPYQIRFQTFNWNTELHPTDCETVPMQLTITPAAALLHGVSASCSGATSTTPSLADDLAAAGGLQVGTNFYWDGSGDSSGSFLSPAPFVQVAPAGTGAALTQVWFYSVNIVVPDAGAQGVRARLNVSVGSRFSWGQVQVLLELGSDRNHCSDTGGVTGTSADCMTGQVSYDQSTINTVVASGPYTIWLYQPEQLDASVFACLVYDLRMSLTWEPIDDSDLFNCAAVAFPSTLDTPMYTLGSQWVHAKHNFLIEPNTQNTTFTVTTVSSFRVTVDSTETVRVRLINANGVSIAGASNQLMGRALIPIAALPVGVYTLSIQGLSLSGNNADTWCPLMTVELALAPRGQTPLMPPPCPPQSRLPSLPAVIAAPFNFSSDVTTFYYRPATGVAIKTVLSFTVTATTSATLHVGVASDFLMSDMIVQLIDASGAATSGVSQYNYNSLDVNLALGTSTVNILTTVRFPTVVCMPFQLDIDLRVADSYTPDPVRGYDQAHCTGGVPVPTSLNLPRFIGADGRLDIQSANWQVWCSGFYCRRDIDLVVADTSVLRFYTEPHAIDIDIQLYQKPAGSNNWQLLMSGFSFNDEESVVWQLVTNTQYRLSLIFWRYNFRMPSCILFNMQIAVEDFARLTPAITWTCPQGGSHWPLADLDGSSVTTYRYSSVDVGESLYYQQQLSEPQSNSVSFYVTNTRSRIYALVGTRFSLAHLVLTLTSVDDSSYSEIGTNHGDSNILRATNLPPGRYMLTVAEPVSNIAQLVSCAPFIMTVIVEEDETALLAPDALTLPSSLMGVGYLSPYSHYSAHLEAPYILFPAGQSTTTISFNTPQESILRVAVEAMLEDYVMVQLSNFPGDTMQYNAKVAHLQPGSYVLTFTLRPRSRWATLRIDAPVVLHTEISLMAASSIGALIAADPLLQITNCGWTMPQAWVVLSPEGYYHYSSSADGYRPRFPISRALQGGPVFSLPFQLPSASVVFAQVSYTSPLTSLSITLTPLSNFNRTFIYGEYGRNLNRVNVELAPDWYVLTVNQDGQWFNDTQAYDHCSIYDFTLIIRNATSDQGVVDCTAFNVLPWNLNSHAGGSVGFGGPIANDSSLNFWGTGFLQPQRSPYDIDFTLLQPAIVSVLTRFGNAYQIPLQMSFLDMAENIILPGFRAVCGYGNLGSFTTAALPAGQYSARFVETYASGFFATSCPAMDLGVRILPAAQLVSQLSGPAACPATAPPQPPTSIDARTSGFQYVSFDSVLQLTPQQLASNQSALSTVFTVAVQAPRGSRLLVSVQYASAVTSWSINAAPTCEAADDPQGLVDAQASLYVGWTTQATTTVVLRAMPLSNVLRAALGAANVVPTSPLCLPYTFNLQVVPIPASIAYILLDPVRANVGTSEALVVDLQLTHTPVNAVNGVAITWQQRLFGSAFTMVSTTGVVPPVAPSSVSPSFDYLTWTLTFPRGQLVSGYTYTLVQRAGVIAARLFNGTTVPFLLPFPGSYVISGTDIPTPSPSTPPTGTRTPSVTRTPTRTPTSSRTPTASTTSTTSMSGSTTSTPSATPTASLSVGASPSNTPTVSLTSTATGTASAYPSGTVPPTPSPTATPSISGTPSPGHHKKGGSATWIFAVVALVLVCLVLAVGTFLAWRRGLLAGVLARFSADAKQRKYGEVAVMDEPDDEEPRDGALVRPDSGAALPAESLASALFGNGNDLSPAERDAASLRELKAAAAAMDDGFDPRGAKDPFDL